MDKLEKVLDDLKCVLAIETAVIVSREGKLIKSYPETGNLNNFVQKTAIILGATETALMELGKVEPDNIIVETENGKMIIIGSGPKALFAAFIKPEAVISLYLVEMNRVAEKIKLLL